MVHISVLYTSYTRKENKLKFAIGLKSKHPVIITGENDSDNSLSLLRLKTLSIQMILMLMKDFSQFGADYFVATLFFVCLKNDQQNVFFNAKKFLLLP